MPPMRRGTSPRRAPADLNEVLMHSMNGTPQGVGDDLLETAPSFGQPLAAPKRLHQGEAPCHRLQGGRATASSAFKQLLPLSLRPHYGY